VSSETVTAARRLVEEAVVTFEDRRIGTVASHAPHFRGASNYGECFVRDFMVSALVFLSDEQPDTAIVRDFLATVAGLAAGQGGMRGHDLHPGVLPASFSLVAGDHGQQLVADFGDRAIGRVAPVDSIMWWTLLLALYERASGDRDLTARNDVRVTLRRSLELVLTGSFEVLPTLLVPDGSCMIDRRMGVYGHPLEVQALFYAMLGAAGGLLSDHGEDAELLERAAQRREQLLEYVRSHYWLDERRLSEINRFRLDEFGASSENDLNISPDSIPEWVSSWLPHRGGYLAGNLGPGRLDVRFFALGNLLAILFGLATEEQAGLIMDLYEARWDDLVGCVPLAISFPAMTEWEWRLVTGCDPKNRPWSYHNGGHWPVLLWPFVAAALTAGRRELAERAVALAHARLANDDWPEYYDGREGRLIGRAANLQQVWTAAALVVSQRMLDRPGLLEMLRADTASP